MFAEGAVEFFNGIAEHGAGHFVGMKVKKFIKHIFMPSLSHFAKHPSGRFVYQIMRMVEIASGDGDGRGCYVVFKQRPCRDNGDTLFPEIG